MTDPGARAPIDLLVETVIQEMRAVADSVSDPVLYDPTRPSLVEVSVYLTRWANDLEALIRSAREPRPDDGGLAETIRLHSADCRAQEAQRQREAEALEETAPPADAGPVSPERAIKD